MSSDDFDLELLSRARASAQSALEQKQYHSAACWALVAGDEDLLIKCLQESATGQLDDIRKIQRQGCMRCVKELDGYVAPCPIRDPAWCMDNWRSCPQAHPFPPRISDEVADAGERLRRQRPDDFFERKHFESLYDDAPKLTVADLEEINDQFTELIRREGLFSTSNAPFSTLDVLQSIEYRISGITTSIEHVMADPGLLESAAHETSKKAMEAFWRKKEQKPVRLAIDCVDYIVNCCRVLEGVTCFETPSRDTLSLVMKLQKDLRSFAISLGDYFVDGAKGGEAMVRFELSSLSKRLQHLQSALANWESRKGEVDCYDLTRKSAQVKGLDDFDRSRFTKLIDGTAPYICPSCLYFENGVLHAWGQEVPLGAEVWGMLERFCGLDRASANNIVEGQLCDLREMIGVALVKGADVIENALCEITGCWPDAPEDFVLRNGYPLDVKDAVEGWLAQGRPRIFLRIDRSIGTEDVCRMRPQIKRLALDYPLSVEHAAISEVSPKVKGFVFESSSIQRSLQFLGFLSGVADGNLPSKNQGKMFCEWVRRCVLIGLRERFDNLREDIDNFKAVGGVSDEAERIRMTLEVDGKRESIEWDPDDYREVDALMRWIWGGKNEWNLSNDRLSDLLWNPWEWRPNFVRRDELAPADGEVFKIIPFREWYFQGSMERDFENEMRMRHYQRMGLDLSDVKVCEMDGFCEVVPKFETITERENRRRRMKLATEAKVFVDSLQGSCRSGSPDDDNEFVEDPMI